MIPKELLYTNEHEWVLAEDDTVTIGITDYAQSELGDIVFVELPEIGATFEQMKTVGTIEAVKTVTDLFCPVSGVVIAINKILEETPEKINKDCYGEGWLIKIKMSDKNQLNALLSPQDYAELIEGED